MTTVGAKAVPQVVGVVTTAIFYGLFFWRTVRQNPGNKLIECGVLAVAVFIFMALMSRIVELPDWVFGSLLLLVFLLCIATLFLLFQRAWRALQHRKAK